MHTQFDGTCMPAGLIERLRPLMKREEYVLFGVAETHAFLRSVEVGLVTNQRVLRVVFRGRDFARPPDSWEDMPLRAVDHPHLLRGIVVVRGKERGRALTISTGTDDASIALRDALRSAMARSATLSQGAFERQAVALEYLKTHGLISDEEYERQRLIITGRRAVD